MWSEEWCLYADLLGPCDQPADKVIELEQEWGGPTPLCVKHASDMLRHISITTENGG